MEAAQLCRPVPWAAASRLGAVWGDRGCVVPWSITSPGLGGAGEGLTGRGAVEARAVPGVCPRMHPQHAPAHASFLQ